MEKRSALLLVAFLCLVAAVGMYVIGEDPQLDELRSGFYIPIPIGLALVFIAFRK